MAGLQLHSDTVPTNRVSIRLEDLVPGKNYIFHFRILNATEDSFWLGRFDNVDQMRNRIRFYIVDESIRNRYGNGPIELSSITTRVYPVSDDTLKKRGGKSYRKRKSIRRKSRRR